MRYYGELVRKWVAINQGEKTIYLFVALYLNIFYKINDISREEDGSEMDG